MKINPFLEKKVLGLSVNEILGITCGAFTGTAAENAFAIENGWLNFLVFVLAWILGLVLYTVVISLIKTFITKED